MSSIVAAYATQDELELFPRDVPLVYLDGSQSSIDSLISEGGKIVLRYSRSNCWNCVEECVSILRKLVQLKVINIKDILIISSEYEIREFILFHEQNTFGFSAYHIGQSIGLKSEELNTPFFFYLTKDCTVRNVFVPIRGEEMATINYLKQVAENDF